MLSLVAIQMTDLVTHERLYDKTKHFGFASSYMSLVVTKLVFGVSDQVPHKPGCTVTEDS